MSNGLSPLFVTPQRADDIDAATKRRFYGENGITVVETREAVTIVGQGDMRLRGGAGPVEFMARIIARAAWGGAFRWKYFFQRVAVDPDGTVVDLEEFPPIVDLEKDFAINTIELNNVESGVQGNSVDNSRGDYPEDYRLQPVGGEGTDGAVGNSVVLWFKPGALSDGTRVYWFSYVNQDDGNCS